MNGLAVGDVGSGKTNLITALAYYEHLKGRKVFSNYNLSFGSGKLNLLDLADPELAVLYNGAVINIDEGHIWFDARNFGKLENKLVSYIYLQSRHRKIDFYVTAQEAQFVDIRFAHHFDFIYVCTAMFYDDELEVLREATIYEIEAQKVDLIRVVKVDMRTGVSVVFLYDPSQYFEMYNTLEFVDILGGGSVGRAKT